MPLPDLSSHERWISQPLSWTWEILIARCFFPCLYLPLHPVKHCRPIAVLLAPEAASFLLLLLREPDIPLPPLRNSDNSTFLRYELQFPQLFCLQALDIVSPYSSPFLQQLQQESGFRIFLPNLQAWKDLQESCARICFLRRLRALDRRHLVLLLPQQM